MLLFLCERTFLWEHIIAIVISVRSIGAEDIRLIIIIKDGVALTWLRFQST